MYEAFWEILPKPVQSMFEKNADVHDHETRQRYNFHFPSLNSNAFQRTIAFKGVHIWSYIRKNIGINCSYERYKRRLRALYLN